ncbi:MAG: hypothetical protein ACJAS9_001642 [Polaribacter sp.]|jgi:hypothetical protein
MEQDRIIQSVKYWLENVIIEFNFCPFAKREFVNQTIHYEVSDSDDLESRLTDLESQFKLLDSDNAIETSLLIFPNYLETFFDYIDFLTMANELLIQLNYEGIYQLASFHPDYCFEDVKQDDASNYTNRSPYPIIHILREKSLESALEQFDKPEDIPERNISFARAKGNQYFKQIMNTCIGG